MPTQVLSIPLASSGPGPSVDVSAMVGPKTVQLTGTFRGAYVVYGSHDGTHFAPLFQFDAGGVEGLRRTFSGALARVLIVSLATNASGVTASISGVVTVLGGDNHFAVLSVLAPGTKGPQPALDLGLTDYVSDLNFIAQGGLSGPVVVEGSLDGVRWNPVGEFSVGSAGLSLLAPAPVEFGPLGTDDLVRYVRVNVLGDVTSTMTVTVGGSRDSSGGVGTSETLAQAYLVGSASVDQTFVLSDARGGGIVVDASGAGFTGGVALQVVGTGGLSAFELWKDGTLRMGRGAGIAVGEVGAPAVVSTGGSVALGQAAQSLGIYSVGVGPSVTAFSDGCLVVGASSLAQWIGDMVIGNNSSTLGLWGSRIVVGNNSHADAGDGIVVVGLSAYGNGQQAIAVGDSVFASGDGSVVVGPGASGFGPGVVVVGSGALAGTGIYFVSYGVALGFQSNVGESYGVAVGYQVEVVPLADHSVVVGSESVVGGPASVVVGFLASTGSGADNVAVGTNANVGGVGVANVCIGFIARVGDYPTETRDFHNNVRVGGGNSVYANFAVSIGNNCVVGDTTDLVPIEDCIAVGTGSTTKYSCSAAFGRNAATTKSNQFVLGSNAMAAYSVHEFAVRGFSATGACDTLLATDAPADGSTGLTVVFNAGGTFSNKILKAATLASIGPTKLVAYFEP